MTGLSLKRLIFDGEYQMAERLVARRAGMTAVRFMRGLYRPPSPSLQWLMSRRLFSDAEIHVWRMGGMTARRFMMGLKKPPRISRLPSALGRHLSWMFRETSSYNRFG